MATETQAGRVLIVAGSDSGGGAGIQADLKSVLANGGYGMTAIAALTAQNSQGVHDVFPVAPAFVARQIEVVLDDIGADAVKTGMLAATDIIEAVAAALDGFGGALVADPVMVASSGDALLAGNADSVNKTIEALKACILSRATLVTPNLPEAEALTGRGVETLDDMKRAADALMDAGAHAALIKGGHARETEIIDLLALQTGFHEIRHARLDSAHTHGTGCTLASAIAAHLAQGAALVPATETAIAYVTAAIAGAKDLGFTPPGPQKPLNHGVTVSNS